MRKLLLLLSFLLIPSFALSTPLSDFLTALTTTGRGDVQIKPYKWKSGMVEDTIRSPAFGIDLGSFYTKSTVRIDGMGKQEIIFSGPRTIVTNMLLTVNYSPMLEDKNPLQLHELKDKNMKVIALREECPQDDTMFYTKVFEITLAGNKQVYALEEYTAGASGEGSSEYVFFNNRDDLLRRAHHIVNCTY